MNVKGLTKFFTLKTEIYMKNILAIIMLLSAFASHSYAGECAGGSCSLFNRPVKKVLVVTKDVVAAPINITREVIKHQPVRRRFFNRSNNCSRCK